MSSIQWSAQKPTSLSTSTPSSSGSHATVFFSFSNPAKACLCLKRQSCVIKFFLDIEILPSNLGPRDSTHAHQGFTYERDLHGCSTDWVTVAWMYDDSILSKIINQVESCIGLGGIRGTMLPAMIRDVSKFFCEKCFILTTSSKIIQHNLGPIVVFGKYFHWFNLREVFRKGFWRTQRAYLKNTIK